MKLNYIDGTFEDARSTTTKEDLFDEYSLLDESLKLVLGIWRNGEERYTMFYNTELEEAFKEHLINNIKNGNYMLDSTGGDEIWSFLNQYERKGWEAIQYNLPDDDYEHENDENIIFAVIEGGLEIKQLEDDWE